MGIDGDAVGELEAGDALRVAGGQARGTAIRRVDVEPEPLAPRQRAELRDEVHRPVLVEPATAQMATGVRPRARSAAIASATGSAWRR